jgi:hypothetical protein
MASRIQVKPKTKRNKNTYIHPRTLPPDDRLPRTFCLAVAVLVSDNLACLVLVELGSEEEKESGKSESCWGLVDDLVDESAVRFASALGAAVEGAGIRRI